MMKVTLIVPLFLAFMAILCYRLMNNRVTASLTYILGSITFNTDSNITPYVNHHNEVEDGIFTHKFVHLTETADGLPTEVTYHSVECGSPDDEPIVFLHGLIESWRVWKDIMEPFCGKYRAIAIDIEGFGQSVWPNPKQDIERALFEHGYDSRKYLAGMELAALNALGVNKFNLVVSDYGFWSSLNVLSSGRVLRYIKCQSTVGVEDISRIQQSLFMYYIPEVMNKIFNGNIYALPRILFGKTHITSDGLNVQKRIGPHTMSDKDFNDIILKEVRKGCYTAWVYFYRYGLKMFDQMALQRELFEKATYPVYIIQGKEDIGQPIELFDGTSRLDYVFDENNKFVSAATVYSGDGTVIGKTALDFFPNSSWKKYVAMDNIGHFVHLEAPQELIGFMKEILEVAV